MLHFPTGFLWFEERRLPSPSTIATEHLESKMLQQMVLERFQLQKHLSLTPLYTLSKAVRFRPKCLFFQCFGGIVMGFREPSTQKIVQNKWFWRGIARMNDHATGYQTRSSSTISVTTWVLTAMASVSHSAMRSKCAFSLENNRIYSLFTSHLTGNRETNLMHDILLREFMIESFYK